MHGVQINQNRQHFTGEEGGQEASSFTVTLILVVRLDSVGGAQAQGPPTFCGALSTGLRLPEARRLCCPGRTPTKEPGPGGIGSPPPVKCYRPEGRRPFLKGAGAKSTAGWGAPISTHGQRRGAANLGEGEPLWWGGAGGRARATATARNQDRTPPTNSGPDYTPHPQPHSGNGALLTHCSQNHGEFTETRQVQLEPISESTSAKRSLSLHFKDD